MVRAAIIAALVAATRADEPPRIELSVGQTAERDVGFALGLLCDDLAIVRAELGPGPRDSNVFRVTGLAAGSTVCRAGTAPSRPSFVFDVHVHASP